MLTLFALSHQYLSLSYVLLLLWVPCTQRGVLGFWLQGFLGAPMSMLLAQQNHRHSHHLLSLCWSSSAGTVIRGRSGAAATTAARWGKRRPGIVTMAANNYRNDVVLATKAVRLASRLCQVTFRIGFCVWGCLSSTYVLDDKVFSNFASGKCHWACWGIGWCVLYLGDWRFGQIGSCVLGCLRPTYVLEDKVFSNFHLLNVIQFVER